MREAAQAAREVLREPPRWLVHAALIALTALALGGVVGHGFVNYDDPSTVTENAAVLGGVSSENLVWALTTTHTANWIPLTWLSLMLDAELWGAAPAGFHATSLLLHVASVLLLFAVLRHWTGALWPSALAAALFAVHPLHVESVAWVSQRKDMLSTCLALLALGAWGLYVRRRRARWYLAALGAFTASLLSKQMFVTLPFLLLLLDYWPLGRLGAGGRTREAPLRLVIEKLPFFALSAVFCLVVLWAQGEGGAIVELHRMPLATRVANAIAACGLYLGRTLWPGGLAVFYPHPGASLDPTLVVNSAIALALITAAVLVVARTHPYALFGWLWFLGTLVPVIGLVQVGSQQMADRYAYVPHIGLFVAAAWLLWSPGVRRLAPRLAAGGIVVALALVTRAQVEHWRDSTSLFRHALSVTRQNYLAHTNLGIALHDQGQLYQALDHYASALEVRPHYHWAHYNRGLVLARLGRYDEAGEHFLAVLRTHPRHARAHNNLGTTFYERGEIEKAIRHYRQSARIEPGYRMAQDNLARALAMLEPGG